MENLSPLQVIAAVILSLVSALGGVCTVLGFVVRRLLNDNTQARKDNKLALDKYEKLATMQEESCVKQAKLTRRLFRKLFSQENPARPFEPR